MSTSPTSWSSCGRSSDRPHEPGELAGARDDDLLAGLAATGHPLPAAVTALLATPRTLENLWVLVAVAARQLVADGRPASGVPRGLDQQPPCVRGAGPRERSLPAGLARRTLARHQPDEPHELRGGSEACEVTDLGGQPDRCERVDPPDATQPADQLLVRAVFCEPGKLCLEVLDAPVDLVDREQIVIECLLLAGQLECLAAEPSATRHTPARRRHPPVMTQDELPSR
jgi:hypothetical protein